MSAPRKRRESVPGRPGIYVRTLADGSRKFEISYYGSDKRRRFKMVAGGVTDAARERRGLMAEIDKGAKVAPTRDTFRVVAERWLERQKGRVRPRTYTTYETTIRVHLNPAFGDKRLVEITEDEIARLIAKMRADGKRPWTISGALTPLSGILGLAARRGWISSNPIERLEPGERPKVDDSGEQRILDPDEISKLLAASPARYRTLLSTAVFTGLRQGELLGLTWEDVDLDAGLLNVRKQLDRQGTRVDVKTEKGRRAVVLMPALAKLLREHKLASPYSSPRDFCFASERGTGMHYRNVTRRGLDKALEGAGLDRIRFHDLRHTFASLLIAQGENVVWVSSQLGHKKTSVTLDTYAHLFAREQHAEQARDRLEAGYGSMLDVALLDRARSQIGEPTPLSPGVPEAPAPMVEVAQLRGIGTQGK